jgi:hypothetical protein
MRRSVTLSASKRKIAKYQRRRKIWRKSAKAAAAIVAKKWPKKAKKKNEGEAEN